MCQILLVKLLILPLLLNLYLLCQLHSNIPNDCENLANFLFGYFNLRHPNVIVAEIRYLHFLPL